MRYLIIILAFLFVGCNNNPPPKTLVEHEQGRHQEKDAGAIKDLIDSKNPDGDTYSFQFTESCKYILPPPKGEGCYLGWNKTLGSSGLNIHCRSLRLVWRYNCITDLFEVASYRYWECFRGWQILASGKVGDVITIQGFKLKHTFYATAYFGGAYPAPHYMYYYIW